MSGYPRPAEAISARAPFPLDRVVGAVYLLLISLVQGAWIVRVLVRSDLPRQLAYYGFYYGLSVLMLLLMLWMLFGLFRSRHWAFVSLIVTVGPFALIYAGYRMTEHLAAVALLLAYSVARLFNMLGPRPLRRHETG